MHVDTCMYNTTCHAEVIVQLCKLLIIAVLRQSGEGVSPSLLWPLLLVPVELVLCEVK